MGSKLEEAAAAGIEAAIHSSTVGIVSGSGDQRFTGIGTGTLVRWRGHHLILTAEHVVAGTRPEDYRFFLPPGDPGKAEREDILKLPGVPERELLPFSELALGSLAVDRELDLAAVAVEERQSRSGLTTSIHWRLSSTSCRAA